VGNETRDAAEVVSPSPVKPAPEPKTVKKSKTARLAQTTTEAEVPPTAKAAPALSAVAVSDHAVAELALLAGSEDRGRLSGYASSGQENEPKNWHTDVVDFNHYAGWFGGETASLGPYLDGIHARHPNSPIGLGEYGAGASIFQHQLPPPRPAPNGRIHPEEYQAHLHEGSWAELATRPFVGTKFVCSLFDFASDGRNEGDQPGRNDKGLMTYDRRVRKDAFFFYKATWSQEPVVNLNSRRFLVRRRPVTDIEVYSNASEVELLLNGQSMGKLTSPNHVFVWKNQTLQPGENNATARAQFGPTTLADGCTWIYEPK
jgi:beta-galactosidase